MLDGRTGRGTDGASSRRKLATVKLGLVLRMTIDVECGLLYCILREFGGLESGVGIKWKSIPTLQVGSGELILDF